MHPNYDNFKRPEAILNERRSERHCERGVNELGRIFGGDRKY
jgi:hypothetical protein